MRNYPIKAKSINGYTAAIAVRIIQDMNYPLLFGRGTVRVVDYTLRKLFKMPSYYGPSRRIKI